MMISSKAIYDELLNVRVLLVIVMTLDLIAMTTDHRCLGLRDASVDSRRS